MLILVYYILIIICKVVAPLFLGWDQSDKYIKVFVTLKNVQSLPKEQVYCTLTEKSMELHVENLENKDYLLVINKLLEPINVGESHWKQKTGIFLIFLIGPYLP